MNIVLETTNINTAYKEKHDWLKLGHKVRITEARKVFRGAYQVVYRVWVSNKRKKK